MNVYEREREISECARVHVLRVNCERVFKCVFLCVCNDCERVRETVNECVNERVLCERVRLCRASVRVCYESDNNNTHPQQPATPPHVPPTFPFSVRT